MHYTRLITRFLLITCLSYTRTSKRIFIRFLSFSCKILLPKLFLSTVLFFVISKTYSQYSGCYKNYCKLAVVLSFHNLNSNLFKPICSLLFEHNPDIHIYSHPQTDCFVASPLFSVARHVRRLKLGSKPTQLYVRLSIRPFGQQAYHAGKGIVRYYVATAAAAAFVWYNVVYNILFLILIYLAGSLGLLLVVLGLSWSLCPLLFL